MDYSRIENVLDVPALNRARVTVVGTGGFAGGVRHLLRCGVKHFTLFDPDAVGEENLCRQEHMEDQVGTPKVKALAAELKRINELVSVETYQKDICAVSDTGARFWFMGTDLFVAATDSYAAQVRVNQIALLLGKPAVFIGVYEGGVAGEVAFWHPGLASCYGCLTEERRRAQEADPGDPPSQGATIVDVSYVDSLANMLCLGLLTRESDNRYGRLIDRLGDRNFLQVKIDPDFGWEGEDFFRTELGIPAGNDAYVSFVTIARRNPDPGGDCPDCRRYRNRRTGTQAIPPATW